MRNFITCYDSQGFVCVSVSDIMCIEYVLPDDDNPDDRDLTLITLRNGRELFVSDSVDSIVRKLRDIEA